MMEEAGLRKRMTRMQFFQLDRYHVYQEILRKINDRSAQREARNLFEEGKTEELLEFLFSVCGQCGNDG